MILMELKNIVLSVTLAKINIISHTILDKDDLRCLISNEQYTNTSISDLMNMAGVKVILNEKFLYLLGK